GVHRSVASAGPVDFGAGRRAKAIAAGASHTCALLGDGSVRCWGRNQAGQLGHGDTSNVGDGAGDPSVAIAPPVDLGAGRRAKAIAAGGGHTCALLDDGSVRCWGRGDSGQLGYGSMNGVGGSGGPDSVANAGPVGLGGGTARTIALGLAHTCAL